MREDITKLIAVCGMNCGLCMAYLRDKNKCFGCRSDKTMKSKYIDGCKIRNCEILKNGKKKYCFECENFPCLRLKQLDTRYRKKYQASMIENLNMIKEEGINKFLENEELKWTCSGCGGTICVHRGKCAKCGLRRFL